MKSVIVFVNIALLAAENVDESTTCMADGIFVLKGWRFAARDPYVIARDSPPTGLPTQSGLPLALISPELEVLMFSLLLDYVEGG